MTPIGRTSRAALRGVVVASATALVAVTQSVAANAGAPSPSGRTQTHSQPSSTSSERYEVAVRTQFGLDHSLAHVRVVDRDQSATARSLGIPLDTAETRNIEARDSLSAACETLDVLNQSSSVYAGCWIDQPAGGVLVVLAHANNLSDLGIKTTQLLHSSGQPWRFESAAHSLAQLNRAYAQIVNAPKTVDFVSATPDIPHNTVNLYRTAGGMALNPQSRSIETQPLITSHVITSKFTTSWTTSTASQPKVAAISRNSYSGQMYGGAWLSNGGPVNGGNCTIGVSFVQNNDGNLYSFTAGHCGSGNYYQGRNRVGTGAGVGHANGFIPGTTGNCDCVFVGPITAAQASKYVLVDNNATYEYHYVAGDTQYKPGSRACLSGAQSADTNNEKILCGTIVASTAEIETFQGFTLEDAAVVSFAGGAAAQDGDSGGPYGNGAYFLGTHSAYNPGMNQEAITKSKYILQRSNGHFNF